MQLASELKPIDLNELIEIAKNCTANHIYLHWSAGHYNQVFDDYNVSIDNNGKIFLPDNCTDLNVFRQHTWHRNTGAVGIALCGCYGAYLSDENGELVMHMGEEPVTLAQIEAMSACIAVICKYANIPIDKDHVMTHYEAACRDGYGVPYGTYVDGVYQGDADCRWDLILLPDSALNGKYVNGGDVLRGKANWYYNYY